MSKLRTLLTAAALVLLTAVSLAAAVRTFMLGIPDSPNPDRSPLVNLLSTRDVLKQRLDSRRSVSQRLERELRRGTDWLAEVEQLDDAQQAMFVANVGELAKIAFLDRIDGYFSQRDERQKDQYLDRQIADLQGWAAVLDEGLQRGEKPVVGPASLAVIFGKISQLHRQADRQQQERIAKFVSALQKRALFGALRRMRLDQGW